MFSRRRGTFDDTPHLAVFGKHPGWDDHIDDLGLDTETLVTAKQFLYFDGIRGNIDTGAWRNIAYADRLDDFNHLLLWRLPDETILGRIWSSADGKGRREYPMVALLSYSLRPPTWAVHSAAPLLESLKQACESATTADEVIHVTENTRRALVASAAQSPRGEHDPTHDPSLGRRINRALDVAGKTGDPAAPHGAAAKLLMAFDSQGHRLRQSDASPAGPNHLRLPRLAMDPLPAMFLWQRFALDRWRHPNTLLTLAPQQEPWVDLIVDTATTADLFALRAGSTTRPYVTQYVPTPDESFLRKHASELLVAATDGAGNGNDTKDAAIPPPAWGIDAANAPVNDASRLRPSPPASPTSPSPQTPPSDAHSAPHSAPPSADLNLSPNATPDLPENQPSPPQDASPPATPDATSRKPRRALKRVVLLALILGAVAAGYFAVNHLRSQSAQEPAFPMDQWEMLWNDHEWAADVRQQITNQPSSVLYSDDQVRVALSLLMNDALVLDPKRIAQSNHDLVRQFPTETARSANGLRQTHAAAAAIHALRQGLDVDHWPARIRLTNAADDFDARDWHAPASRIRHVLNHFKFDADLPMSIERVIEAAALVERANAASAAIDQNLATLDIAESPQVDLLREAVRASTQSPAPVTPPTDNESLVALVDRLEQAAPPVQRLETFVKDRWTKSINQEAAAAADSPLPAGQDITIDDIDVWIAWASQFQQMTADPRAKWQADARFAEVRDRISALQQIPHIQPAEITQRRAELAAIESNWTTLRKQQDLASNARLIADEMQSIDQSTTALLDSLKDMQLEASRLASRAMDAAQSHAELLASIKLSRNVAELLQIIGADDADFELTQGAYLRLGAIDAAWPSSMDQLKQDHAALTQLKSRLAALSDEAARAAAKPAIDAASQHRWRNIAERADTAAAIHAAMSVRTEYASDIASLSPRPRFNARLWTAQTQVAADIDTAGAIAIAKSLLAEITRLPDAAATDPAAVSLVTTLEPLTQSGAVVDIFDFSAAGPGAAGWSITPPADLLSLQYTWKSDASAHALSFRRIGFAGDPRRSPIYLATTEMSLGLAMDLLNTAQLQDGLQRRRLLAQFLGTAIERQRRAGPSSWTWSAGDAAGPLLPASAWQSMLPPDEGPDADRPNRRSPWQHITPAIAAWTAAFVDCRLPTPQEWTLALAVQSDAGQPNLRDRTWEDLYDRSRKQRTDATPWPDEGAFVAAADREKIRTARRARTVNSDDGAAWFVDVDQDLQTPFMHLRGNVAELLASSRPTLDVRSPIQLGQWSRDPDTTFSVVGGSAISPPEIDIEKPTPMAAGDLQKPYADVGFRLAFTLPRPAVSKQIAMTVEAASYLAPKP